LKKAVSNGHPKFVLESKTEKSKKPDAEMNSAWQIITFETA